MKRIPAEDNLDLFLSFCRTSPEIAAYEDLARENGLRVATDDVAPEYGLIKGERFGLMLVDQTLARLHVAGFFGEEDQIEDSEGEESEALGVIVVSSGAELTQLYERLLGQLEQRLGPPTSTESWSGELDLGCNDNGEERLEDHEFAFAAWSFEDSVLVLLMNDEGDGQIGEMATVDLRIAPRQCRETLPDSVKEPFAWPIEL